MTFDFQRVIPPLTPNTVAHGLDPYTNRVLCGHRGKYKLDGTNQLLDTDCKLCVAVALRRMKSEARRQGEMRKAATA